MATNEKTRVSPRLEIEQNGVIVDVVSLSNFKGVPKITFGREADPEADPKEGAYITLKVEKKEISRDQLVIIPEGRRFYLTRCSPSVKTFLNGELQNESDRRILPNGSTIRFHNFTLKFIDDNGTRYGDEPKHDPNGSSEPPPARPPADYFSLKKAGLLIYKGKTYKLTPQAHKLMKCLDQEWPEVCDLDDLNEALKWDEGARANLNTLVGKIRKTMGLEKNELIENVRSFGYRLILTETGEETENRK